jgi:hypothetical protein
LKRAALALLVACGGSEKPAPTVQTPMPVVDAGAIAPPASTVSGADPNAMAQLLASAAAAASATMQPAGSADEADRGLREAAAKHAAGMTPDGDVAKGTLSEGGHLGFITKMDPTKCYTIVAYGAGVEELDLFLLVPPFYNLLGAHDVTTGPSAVIGASPKMCPIAPIAVPYKIDMHARKGGGSVVAQVFSKPK